MTKTPLARRKLHPFRFMTALAHEHGSEPRENPLGVGGTALHGWAFATRTFQAQLFQKQRRRDRGLTTTLPRAASHNVGAWIMGRNMFGPVRRFLA